MLKYKLENKSELLNCEICSEKLLKTIAVIDIKEFHKDGTIKLHHSCSNHIIDLYNKIELNNIQQKQQEELIAI